MKCGVVFHPTNWTDWERYSAAAWDRPPEIPDSAVWERAIRMVELVEPLGYDKIWTTEHRSTPYGFIPNPLVSYRGLFEVNTFHNIVHIVSGGILLASPYYNAPVITLRVFGVIYAIVTILGFISLNSLNSMGMATNHPDNWLHLILAIVLLWAGFALPAEDTDRVTTAHM